MCSSLGQLDWDIVQLWVLNFFFFPVFILHTWENCPVMAKPVSCESHPEWLVCSEGAAWNTVWTLRVTLETNEMWVFFFFFFLASWIEKFHMTTFGVLTQLCQCSEKTCQLYILKQNKNLTWNRAITYSEIVLCLKVCFFLCYCWCIPSIIFSNQDVIKQLWFM